MSSIKASPVACCSKHRVFRRGFTLIEAVVSTLIVGTVAVTSLYSSLTIAQSYRQLAANSKAGLLAERYLTEILQAYYSDPVSPVSGPESDESTTSRIDFDDVDDYHGRLESPPQLRTGQALPEYGSPWSVFIQVSEVPMMNPGAPTASDTGLKRITVEVTDARGKKTKLYGLRSRQGGKDRNPALPSTQVQWIGLNLRHENASRPLFTGTSPMNQAPSED